MKLAIVGSRSFKDYNLLHEIVAKHFNRHEIEMIISGGASGADSLARQFAEQYNLKLVEHIPEWEKFGKKAGYLRNILIVQDCDILLAFWSGDSKESPGTLSSIRLAYKYKKSTFIYYVGEGKDGK